MRYNLWILALIVIIGCVKSNNEIKKIGNFTISKYFENGKIEKEISLSLPDSILNGPTIEYFRNGNISKIINYTSGKKDSTERINFETGEIQSLQFWSSGKRWGEYVEFWNGLYDEYYQEIENDTIIVKDPLVKIYRYYNKNEKVIFERRYNENGNIISQEGIGIEVLTTDKQIKNGEFTEIRFFLVNPPWVERQLLIFIYNENSQLIYSENLEVVNDAYKLLWKANDIGRIKIEAVFKIKDLLEDNIKSDTVLCFLDVLSSES